MEVEGLLKFRGNDALSDIALKKAAAPDAVPLRAHKVVLAAASDLFFDLFTKENQELVAEFEIPAPIETKMPMTEDPYTKAFSYMYWDQTFDRVKDEIDDKNVFQLYSVAYTLKVKKLVKDLEQYIVNRLLNTENCLHFYLDAIRFKSEIVTSACERMLVQEYKNLKFPQANAQEIAESNLYLNQLPLTYFQNLMAKDELNVENENKVMYLVEQYIRHRSDIPYDKTREEKKAEREANQKEGEEPIPDPEEEEKKNKEEQYNALDDKGKIQWKYNDQVEQMRKKSHDRMRVKGLRSEEKKELLKTIRYAFLTHQELLKCSRDPLFNEAKEYIVEGLTHKIEPEEVEGKDDTLISLVPRYSYGPDDYDYDDPNIKEPQQHRLDHKGIPHKELSPRGHNNRVHAAKANTQHPRRHPKEATQKYRHDMTHGSPRLPHKSPHHDPYGPNGRGYDAHHTLGHPGNKSQISYPPRNLGGMDDTFAREDAYEHDDTHIPPYPPVKFGMPGQGKTKKHGPQANWTTKQPVKTSFDYSFDFDENGVFYYLGTEGGRKIWQNPHTISQIQAFASSIGFGSVHDLVGRKCVNLRTLNEPFSFFGVDLGEGRKLLPTCYTIMNRNSSTHVLMNWHFEGSNDKLNWTILDRRVYLPDQLDSGSGQQDYLDDEIVEALCQKQATNTWGVDQNIYNDIDDEGFRFFRIIQISPNSSGSDNLALSCLEIYGKVVSGRFP